MTVMADLNKENDNIIANSYAGTITTFKKLNY